jgi:hypothetical protein
MNPSIINYFLVGIVGGGLGYMLMYSSIEMIKYMRKRKNGLTFIGEKELTLKMLIISLIMNIVFYTYIVLIIKGVLK